MRFCKDCEFFIADGVRCAAPQLVELSRMVDGSPAIGKTLPAFLVRLNQSLCGGSTSFWFIPKAPPPPETAELPALA